MKKYPIFAALIAALTLLCACSGGDNASAPTPAPSLQSAEAAGLPTDIQQNTAAPSAGPSESAQTEPPADTNEATVPRIEPWDGVTDIEGAGLAMVDSIYTSSLASIEERSEFILYGVARDLSYEKHVYPAAYDYPEEAMLYAVYEVEIIDCYKGGLNPGDTVKLLLGRGNEFYGDTYFFNKFTSLKIGGRYVLFLIEGAGGRMSLPYGPKSSIHWVYETTGTNPDGSKARVLRIEGGTFRDGSLTFEWLEGLK